MFVSAWHVRLKQYYPENVEQQEVKEPRILNDGQESLQHKIAVDSNHSANDHHKHDKDKLKESPIKQRKEHHSNGESPAVTPRKRSRDGSSERDRKYARLEGYSPHNINSHKPDDKARSDKSSPHNTNSHKPDDKARSDKSSSHNTNSHKPDDKARSDKSSPHSTNNHKSDDKAFGDKSNNEKKHERKEYRSSSDPKYYDKDKKSSSRSHHHSPSKHSSSVPNTKCISASPIKCLPPSPHIGGSAFPRTESQTKDFLHSGKSESSHSKKDIRPKDGESVHSKRPETAETNAKSTKRDLAPGFEHPKTNTSAKIAPNFAPPASINILEEIMATMDNAPKPKDDLPS
jgi:hypothetical protein